MFGVVDRRPLTLAMPDSPHPAAPFVTLLDPLYAPVIASWVKTEQELTWLAPGTLPPLTPQKVLSWSAQYRGRRLLFWPSRDDGPIGYAELNYLSVQSTQMWIGHFLIDPAQRGRSYGAQFARLMITTAFEQCGATEVLLVVFPDNLSAIRCYQRAGFIVTGEEARFFATTGREHSFLRMGITQAGYRQAAARRPPAHRLAPPTGRAGRSTSP